jgi:hypothetical protein
LIEQRRTGWDFDTTGEQARMVTVQPGFALIRQSLERLAQNGYEIRHNGAVLKITGYRTWMWVRS